MRRVHLAVVLVFVAFTGCIPFPHTHTKRPALRMRIVDSAGRTLSNARAVLYRGTPLLGRLRRFYIAPANSDGRIDVAERHAWHWIFIAVPDAEAPWEWAWCIEAPGYRTEWRTDESQDGGGTLPLLRRPNADSCPALIMNHQHLAALRMHRDTLAIGRPNDATHP